MRGRLASRYWLRWASGESDQDLYETLTLDLANKSTDAVTGHFMGRLTADLDGSEDGASPFFQIQDTSSTAVTGLVYDAHADLHRVPGFEVVRVGRQFLNETPEYVLFDGALAATKPWGAANVQFSAYGGMTTHLYEQSESGDWTFGLFGEGRAWEGSWWRFDWMHLEDEELLGPHQNDLLAARLGQTVGKWLRLDANYSRLEGDDRDVGARATLNDAASESMLQLNYYQLLTTQNSLVLELDPFYNSLYELYPYAQYGGLASHRFGKHVELALGADLRRVDDSSDVGEFNRDYERYYGTCRLHDVGWDGFAVGLTADVWRSQGQDTETWGFDLSQRVHERWTAEAGSYYSLYKFDLYLEQERDHVRTYYARVRHDASKSLVVDCSYELEDNDFDVYQVLILGVTWRF